MNSEAPVRPSTAIFAPLTTGVNSTGSQFIGSTATGTTLPFGMQRSDFTYAVTVKATGIFATITATVTATSSYNTLGTGTIGSTGISTIQASNDKVSWFAIGTLTAVVLSTQTGTVTNLVTGTATVTATVSQTAAPTVGGAGAQFQSYRFAWTRNVVSVTGTGNATVVLGM